MTRVKAQRDKICNADVKPGRYLSLEAATTLGKEPFCKEP
jgi:hypothetical protein